MAVEIICNRQHVPDIIVGVTKILDVAARDERGQAVVVWVVSVGGRRAALEREIHDLVGRIVTRAVDVAIRPAQSLRQVLRIVGILICWQCLCR